MSKKIQNILIIVLVIIILALLARFVIFKNQFNSLGENLEQIGERQDNYKKENPDASKEQINQTREQGMDNIKKREEDYKAQHPDATDEDIQQARDNLWSGSSN